MSRKITWARKLLAKFLLLWIKSLRIDKQNYPEKPFLSIIWHEDTFYGIQYIRHNLPLTIPTSDSPDGDIVNNIMRNLNFDVIRGSSNRKQTKTLVKLIKAAKNKNNIAITIDGPRGPRHIPKPGAFIVSQKTGLPIYCVRFVVKGFRIKSMWDKLFVPYPFAKVKIFLSSPIFVKQSKNKKQREIYLNEAMEESIKMLNHTLPNKINAHKKQFDFYLD